MVSKPILSKQELMFGVFSSGIFFLIEATIDSELVYQDLLGALLFSFGALVCNKFAFRLVEPKN
jgi:hypothetical protein